MLPSESVSVYTESCAVLALTLPVQDPPFSQLDYVENSLLAVKTGCHRERSKESSVSPAALD